MENNVWADMRFKAERDVVANDPDNNHKRLTFANSIQSFDSALAQAIRLGVQLKRLREDGTPTEHQRELEAEEARLLQENGRRWAKDFVSEAKQLTEDYKDESAATYVWETVTTAASVLTYPASELCR